MRRILIIGLLLAVAAFSLSTSPSWAANNAASVADNTTSMANNTASRTADNTTSQVANNTPSDVQSARHAAASLPPSAEVPAFKKAIRAKYDLKERAFASHDAETIVTQFYSPDVISVGQGEGIYIGREQIRPLYQDVVKTNKVKVDSLYTFVKGDAGWDWTDFHVYPTDGKTAPFTFVILFLWARIDGQWICKGDFFVTGSLKDGKLTAAPAGSQ